MQKQVKLKIHGHVQGVFFRRHTEIKAKELGLTGWACNTANGTVEVLAEGEEEKLQEFIKWCKDGPEEARVEKVAEEWSEPEGGLKDFLIK